MVAFAMLVIRDAVLALHDDAGIDPTGPDLREAQRPSSWYNP
jgi:hypothetical protein